MPRISDDTLLAHAIRPAILDRLSLAEAHHGVGEVADEARENANRFRSLVGKKLSSLSSAESDLARLCFIYAEQYEQSRADARVETGRLWKEDPRRRADSFREVRIRRWGKTSFEEFEKAASRLKVHDWLIEETALVTQRK